jgi:hypothetical protein
MTSHRPCGSFSPVLKTALLALVVEIAARNGEADFTTAQPGTEIERGNAVRSDDIPEHWPSRALIRDQPGVNHAREGLVDRPDVTEWHIDV